MKQIKVSEAKDAALDWLVNEAQGHNTKPPIVYQGCVGGDRSKPRKYLATEGGFTIDYSDWGQGGPIIERENIALYPHGDGNYEADVFLNPKLSVGPTPLIAAMRCYVASKLGEIVEVPDEL